MKKPAPTDNRGIKIGTSGIRFKLCAVMVGLALIVNCATEMPPTQTLPVRGPGEAVRVANLANWQIREASGLASSRLYPGVLWAINDGGNAPLLYAVGTDGADLGTFRVEGALNYDWEDLASFRLQDTAYLLIADVGDNWQQRENAFLYVVEEPAITAAGLNEDMAVDIAWQIRFTFEGGARDCEAVAVDIANQRVLLLSKGGLLPVLYELPLQPADSEATVVARPLTSVPYFNWPTAMDFATDSLTAAVLTYNHAYLIVRRDDEDWSAAFAATPSPVEATRGRVFWILRKIYLCDL
ncbi:MAG: hypothetical protein ACYS4T_20310 [Planctomycetota bacterium]|jgi:hypothetical protein